VKILKAATVFVLLASIAFAQAACSGSSKGQSPVEPSTKISELPESFGTEDTSGLSVLAVYDAVIDPVAKTFTVTPMSRESAYHFPLNNYLPNVLQIVDYGWTPNFWADIKLTHPFPGSGIDGFDPRVIAIIPANPGVSFNYPLLNCIGNNSVVLNPDGYTKLFDGIGGSIPGNTNPFKAYFKVTGNRVWAANGQTTATQRWQMRLSGFGGPMIFKLVVDISTNYPNPPQEGVDNAPEPVDIKGFVYDYLTPQGGSVDVDVEIIDWQGISGSTFGAIEAPDLFTGLVNFQYDFEISQYQHAFTATISNDLNAPEGDYKMLIAFWDSGTSIFMFKEFDIIVREPSSFNPVDVTSIWLEKMDIRDIYVDNNYMFILSKIYPETALLIYDKNAEPVPHPISYVDGLTWDADEIQVQNGYLYIANGLQGMEIIDIDPIESAHIVKTVSTGEQALDIGVSSNYACIVDEGGLEIVDISVPENASIVRSLDIDIDNVDLSTGYAFGISEDNRTIMAIDIDPPQSAYVVSSLSIGPRPPIKIQISEGYAYVIHDLNTLDLVDIDPPESMSLVSQVSVPGNHYDLCVYNGFAYVTSKYGSGGYDFYVIDVEPPENPYMIKTLEVTYKMVCVTSDGEYAYAGTSEDGVQFIDVNPPEMSQIIYSFCNPHHPKCIEIDGDNVYMGDSNRKFVIIDKEPIESAHLLNMDIGFSIPNDMDIVGDYAFCTCAGAFESYRIEPPETTHSVGIFKGSLVADYVEVSNSLAYTGGFGFKVFDVNQPENPEIIKEIYVSTGDLDIQDGYAYIAGNSGLNIIDIEPLDSASLVGSLSISERIYDVDVEGNYCYLADEINGLRIVNVESPTSPFIVKTVFTPTFVRDVYFHNGYVYIAGGQSFYIIDAVPPQGAYIATSMQDVFSSSYTIQDIKADNDYAYLAVGGSGLRIFRLH